MYHYNDVKHVKFGQAGFGSASYSPWTYRYLKSIKLAITK